MSRTFTEENPAHPDYPYSPEASNERLFFSQLNDNNQDRIKDWNELRSKSYGKPFYNPDRTHISDKENSEFTNVTSKLDSTPIHPKTVFNFVNSNNRFKNQMLDFINKPTLKSNLPRGGRKRTRVFRKKSNKRRTSKSSRHTNKLSRRTNKSSRRT